MSPSTTSEAGHFTFADACAIVGPAPFSPKLQGILDAMSAPAPVQSDEDATREAIAHWQAQITTAEQRQAAHESWLTSVSVTNPGVGAFYGDRRDETAAKIKRLSGYIADAERALAESLGQRRAA